MKTKEEKREQARQYYLKNRERILERGKEYRSIPEVHERTLERNREYYKNPEVKKKRKEYRREYEKRPYVKARRSELRKKRYKADNSYWLERNHGITQDQRQAMFDAQKGKCAICGCALDDGLLTHIDHNHESGVIRGLLCHNCNRGIGYLKDNVAVLEKAAVYLEKYND